MKKLNTLIFAVAVVLVSAFTVRPVFAQTTTPTTTTTVTVTPTVTTKAQGAVSKARTLALKIFDDQFLSKLNSLRAKVSASTTLGDEGKTALLAKIDAEITWFTTKRESANTATTLVQIRAIIKEARARFVQDGKDLRKLHIAHGFVTRLEQVITNLENNIVTKMEKSLTTIGNNGTNITTELTLLLKAKSEITAAKTDVTEIRNSTTYETAKKNYDEAKTRIKNARNYLKQVLDSLKGKVGTN